MDEACTHCGRPWTKAETALLLRNRGLAVDEIAAQLELTPRRVQQLLRGAGLAGPKGRPRKIVQAVT